MKIQLTSEDLAIYLPYKLMIETKGNERTELVGLKGDTAFLKELYLPM